MKKLIFYLLFISMSYAAVAQNQQKNMYFTNHHVDFSSGSPVISQSFPSASNAFTQTTFNCSNGYYGPQGNLVFYVKGSGSFLSSGPCSATVYGNTGAKIDEIAVTQYYFQNGCSIGPFGIASEVSVVPAPGNCNQYYLIYLYYNVPTTSGCGIDPHMFLAYSVLDMSLNSGAGGIVPGQLDVLLDNFGMVDEGLEDGVGGIAVGKLRTDNFGHSYRFMYVAAGSLSITYGQVHKFAIGANGIVGPFGIYFSSDADTHVGTEELDLSPDGTMLAFGNLKITNASLTKDVTVIYLDANGDYSSIWQPQLNSSNTFTHYTGVEFSPDNTKLYVGANGVGIYRVNVQSQTVDGLIPIATIPVAYSNSQLETSYILTSGEYAIMAASSTTNIGAITNPNETLISNITFNQNFVNFSSNEIIAANTSLDCLPSFCSAYNAFTLPDQQDGENYDYHFPECCNFNAAFDVGTYTEQGSNLTQTWSPGNNPFNSSGTVRVSNTITIQSSYNITIQNMTFEFGPSGKIVLYAGAHLTLDGTTLTSHPSCTNEMWKGIEVWGNSNQPQTATAQGKITVMNYSVIENAENAIRVWRPGDYSSTGGIVWGINSTFRNNKRGVEFVSYQYGNTSRFTNCNFTIDNNYLGSNNFYAHVTMSDVKGNIFFENCLFENAQTNVPSALYLGYGIYSIDATFFVVPTCDVAAQTDPCWVCPQGDIHPSTFRNLLYGIYATVSSSNRNFLVDQSVFENNIIGINSRAVNNATITNNSLTIGDNSAPLPAPAIHTGLVLNTGSGYKVEHNQFEQSPSTPAGINTAGVWVRNTGTANNEIYRNNFTSLYLGNVSQGVNKNITNTQEGLQFLCNINNSNTFRDISVLANVPPGTPSEGIRKVQGDPNGYPAGNEFSYNGQPEGDIYSDPLSVIYYYYSNVGNQPPLNYTPLYVVPIPPQPGQDPNPCPCTIGGGGHGFFLSAAMIQQLTDDYNDNESAYLNVLYNYDQLIDGGNTNVLLEEIEITWSADAWTLRNELIARSPYLSEDALRKAALTGTLPNAMMLEVCLANPDATKSDAFIKFLQYEIPNPMPTYMTDMIMATWSGITARTILEGSLASYGHKMAVAGDLLLSNYLLDVDNDHTEDIRYWLDRIQTLSAKYALCEDYFQEGGKLTDAENVLNSIPDDFTLLKGAELDQYNRYVEYFNFRKDIINSGRNLMQMDNTEIGQLTTFANAADDLPGVMAQNLLCFGYNICPTYNPELPGGGGNRIATYFTGNAKSFYNEIRVSPNPAVEFAAFSYDLPVMEKQVTLSITDLTGRIVQEFTLTNGKGQLIWDTRLVHKGVYLYHIKGDYSDQTRGKILVK